MKTEQERHYLTTRSTESLRKAHNPCVPCEIAANLVVKNLHE
jgi:hypothetical protein